jgi:hypothetical protein
VGAGVPSIDADELQAVTQPRRAARRDATLRHRHQHSGGATSALAQAQTPELVAAGRPEGGGDLAPLRGPIFQQGGGGDGARSRQCTHHGRTA